MSELKDINSQSTSIQNILSTEELGEGHITLFLFNYESIGQGTWTFSSDDSTFFGANYGNGGTHADGDNITLKVYLDAGTYTLRLMSWTSPNEGIVDIDIDGVEVASFDLYSVANPARDVLNTETGIVISTAGIKTLRFRVDGKNASAIDYYFRSQCISLWRTA